MEAVITGDIVASRTSSHPKVWQVPLKKILKKYGSSPKFWEIYRGDSFQLKLPADLSLHTAIHIKAAMRSQKLDARMAIGLGTISHLAAKITESTGVAFEHSGEMFDQLYANKKRLEFKSGKIELDKEINMLLLLASTITDNWTQNSAATMNEIFFQPQISQMDLAKKLGISQPSVSARLKVAHADVIVELLRYYTEKITHIMQKI